MPTTLQPESPASVTSVGVPPPASGSDLLALLTLKGPVPRSVAMCPVCCRSLTYEVETAQDLGEGARVTNVLLDCGSDDDDHDHTKAEWAPIYARVVRWVNGARPNTQASHERSSLG